MRFKDFFEETTSTADVACFARPVMVSVKKKRKKINEVSWLQSQAPTAKDYAKTIAGGLVKTGINAIPLVGSFSELGETALKLYQLRQQGKDVTNLILQLLSAKDKSPGVPADFFDMDDRLSNVISPQAKMEIAKLIIQNIDSIIQQVQAGQIPQNNANKIAVDYITNIIKQI